MSDSSLPKAYVHPDNTASIVCPVCNFPKLISAEKFLNQSHILKVRCKCDNCFKVQLEFRRSYRKKTRIEGSCLFDLTPGESLDVKLANLSMGGVCVELLWPHDVNVGEKGVLRFTLDDPKKTVIIKRFTVRSVIENRIGCEFFDDKAYQKELGFYLRH